MTDPRADPKRFDPRFDPAFQPGYDPGSDPSAAARSTPRRFDAAPPTQLTPPERVSGSGFQAAVGSSAPPESAPSPVTPSPVTPSSVTPVHRAAAAYVDAASVDAVSVDELDSEAETTDDPAPARGVNPFVVTLWVVSVVLIAAGIAVFRSLPGIEQQGLLSTGDTSITSFGQVYSLAVLAAVLVGTGTLVAAGNLFVLAARWANRPR